MRRFFLCGLAGLSVAAASPAFALRAPGPGGGGFNQPTKQKVMQAEVAVVGKVSSIDKETVDLEPSPGAAKVAHTVANVKLETVLFGVKNVTHVKIAFVKAENETQPLPGGPGGGFGKPGRPFPGRQPAFVPAEDQEGIFFLQKHPTSAGHFIVQPGMNPILSTEKTYKDELKTVTAMSAAFADPVKALKAEDETERLTAGLALAVKYRGYPVNNNSGVVDEAAIPAEETKLFLKVLTDADWTKNADAPRLADALGLMPGSFGIPVALPGDGEEALAVRQKAFKAWAEKYGAKFEVKKYTAKPLPAQKNQPTPGGGVRPVPLPAPAPGGFGGGVAPAIEPLPPRILK